MTIINFIHVLVVIFIIGVPFTNIEYLLSIHLLVVPFIVLHWLTNQSVCALTEIEKFITNKRDDDETFFGKIMGPIYKFKTKEEETLFLYGLMACLFTISYIKLSSMGFQRLKLDFHKFTAFFNRHPQNLPEESFP